MNHTIIEQMILVAAFRHVQDFEEFQQTTNDIDGNEFAPPCDEPESVLAANALLDAERITRTTLAGDLRYSTLEERVDDELFEAWLHEGDYTEHLEDLSADDSVALGLITVQR